MSSTISKISVVCILLLYFFLTSYFVFVTDWATLVSENIDLLVKLIPVLFFFSCVYIGIALCDSMITLYDELKKKIKAYKVRKTRKKINDLQIQIIVSLIINVTIIIACCYVIF